MRRKVPAGKRFGSLVCLVPRGRRTKTDGTPCKNIAALCICDCGNLTAPDIYNLLAGKVNSCGCQQGGKPVHGHWGTRTYRIWASMKGRCLTPSAGGYSRYGAKGVTVCERWLTFENFLADMGEAPEGMSINRIGGATLYSPETCEWASNATQARDKKRTIWVDFAGEKMCLADAAIAAGLKYGTVFARYRRGLRGEELFASRHAYLGRNQFSD